MSGKTKRKTFFSCSIKFLSLPLYYFSNNYIQLKMKMKTMLCAVLLFLSMAAQAQNQEAADSVAKDSVVRVIGWFCKTDTLEYNYSMVVAEVVGTDTTVVEAGGNDFSICVTDSTKKGYTMELVNSNPWRSDSTSAKGRMTLEAARMAAGTKVRFSTDEMGVFQGIINWKELYKNALDYQDKLVNRIYYEHPALYARQNISELKKQIKQNTEELMGSKEKITNLFNHLKLLFAFHGKQLPVGESTINMEGNSLYYLARMGALEDESDSNENEYQLYSEITGKDDEGVPTHYYYDYAYFDDGWPRSVTATVDEEKADKRVITQMTISWLRKAW